jgi:hypothetical protein
VTKDLLCGFQIAVLTGVCRPGLAELSGGTSLDAGLVAGSPLRQYSDLRGSPSLNGFELPVDLQWIGHLRPCVSCIPGSPFFAPSQIVRIRSRYSERAKRPQYLFLSATNHPVPSPVPGAAQLVACEENWRGNRRTG